MIQSRTTSLLRAAPRLIQILRVLARHQCLGALFGKRHLPSPKNLREAFQDLGLTFLKFGQVLALRRDLLPDAYISELELLHDQLPALPFQVIRATVENELDGTLEDLFASFRATPMGTASIAQVHEAYMHDGRRVAVKVQRPDLDLQIATDIAAMSFLVALGERCFPRILALDLPVLVGEFQSSLTRETDFSREARSILLFRTALAGMPELWIPDVVAERSNGKVLTLEFAAGQRVDLFARDHPEAVAAPIETLVRVMLQTIFEAGLFHADPHSGNVFVLEDGRLCLLDFGMTGELDELMRESLTRLLEAVVTGDAKGAKQAYLEMAPQGVEKVNRGALLIDIRAVLHEIHRNDLAEVSIGDTFNLLLRAGSRHGVHNPPEFFLLTRAFVILEGMIRQLDPGHNYLGSFRSEVSRLTANHFSLERVKDKTTKLGRDLERLLGDAPSDLRRMLRRMAEGDLGRMQSPGIEALGGRVSRNLERLTLGIASAGLVIGGSMLAMSPLKGWQHLLGVAMVIPGMLITLIVCLGALGRDRGRR